MYLIYGPKSTKKMTLNTERSQKSIYFKISYSTLHLLLLCHGRKQHIWQVDYKARARLAFSRTAQIWHTGLENSLTFLSCNILFKALWHRPVHHRLLSIPSDQIVHFSKKKSFHCSNSQTYLKIFAVENLRWGWGGGAFRQYPSYPNLFASQEFHAHFSH